MDKLRKFGLKLWYFKERLILIAVVVALCYCVYRVIYPPEMPPIGRLPVPSATAQVPPPPPPPEVSLLSLPESYSSLAEKNPFWFHTGRTPNEGDQRARILASIALRKIRKMGETKKAQIQTATTTEWYDEGAEFEQFELRQINPDEKTCVVYSEGLGEEITLTEQR